MGWSGRRPPDPASPSRASRPRPERLLSLATGVLLVVTALRAAIVVLPGPVLGYANSYDFLRTSSCTGVWVWAPGTPRDVPFREGPLPFLVNDGVRIAEWCRVSSDLVFANLLASLHAPGDVFAIKEVGAARVLAILVLLLLAIQAVRSVRVRFAMALAACLTLGDLAMLLYANTLYTEMSVVGAGFITAATTVALLSDRRRPSRALLLVTVVAATWFGLAKLQYTPLAGILLAAAAVGVWRRFGARRPAALLAAFALAVPVAGVAMMRERPGGAAQYANATDTFLGAVLPAATDTDAALSILGLPPSCKAGIGSTWYTPGVPEHHPCPDVLSTSRASLLRLFATQPATFTTPMALATQEALGIYATHIGRIETSRTTEWPDYRALEVTSLSAVVTALPREPAWQAGALAMLAGPAALAVAALRRRLGERARLVAALLGVGGCTTFYAIFSSVFGDGYWEVAKHAVLLTCGLALVLSAGFVALAEALLAAGDRGGGPARNPASSDPART